MHYVLSTVDLGIERTGGPRRGDAGVCRFQFFHMSRKQHKDAGILANSIYSATCPDSRRLILGGGANAGEGVTMLVLSHPRDYGSGSPATLDTEYVAMAEIPKKIIFCSFARCRRLCHAGIKN